MDPTSPTPRSQTYHLRVAVERRQVEGRASVLVCVVGGSSALHQEADDGQMSFEAGPAQSGQTLLVRQGQRGSWEKKRTACLASCWVAFQNLFESSSYSDVCKHSYVKSFTYASSSYL